MKNYERFFMIFLIKGYLWRNIYVLYIHLILENINVWAISQEISKITAYNNSTISLISPEKSLFCFIKKYCILITVPW